MSRSLLHLLAATALAGCGGGDLELLDSWVGVYEVDELLLDTEACTAEGPVTDSPSRYLQVDAIVRDEGTTLNLRQCSDVETCGVPWFEVVVDELRERELTGEHAQYLYLPIGGSGGCTLQWTELTLTRSARGVGEPMQADVRSYVLEDVPVESEVDCVELLDELASERDCDARHVFETTRVR